MPTLTATQAEALTWLEKSHAEQPDWEFGFNPESKALARACRHTLEPMGLVSIRKMSANHFRYLITDTGREALAAWRRTKFEVEERRAARRHKIDDGPRTEPDAVDDLLKKVGQPMSVVYRTRVAKS
jgi:hypothetical protein